ncbi:MAG: phage/plasmid primase, P4 family [Bacteroidota bacterium]|nr:phage/plasmid primase, P4 family [Bacteroidota bacterium]
METALTQCAAPLNGKHHPLGGNTAVGTVTIAELQVQTTQDAAAHVKPAAIVPHNKVLKSLLKKVQKLDFRKIVGLDNETEKLKQKHYVVTVVDETLALAAQNRWGLCRNLGFVYVYNGACWQPVQEDDLKAFLQDAALRMGVDKYDARYVDYALQLHKQFMSAAYLPAPEKSRDAVRINLLNGTFHIGAGRQELRAFDRADFMIHQLPFAYNSAAVAPLFHRFLNRVLPDEDCQNILAEYLGYVFVSPAKLKLEKTLLLYGSGANGKSVLFEIVTALLGPDNVSHYSLQSLTVDPSYARAHLANKLLNYASEISGKSDPNVFKQLVSGEPVEARFPYGQPFTLTDYAKLIFNCNELPADVEHTLAYFRRFLILPFKETIPEAEQDKQLAAKIIAAELSGVFNWVLTGLNRLLEQGRFTHSEAVSKQIDEYRLQSDSVRSFLDDNRYEASTTNAIARQVLYADYRVHCQDEGNRPVNARNFAKRLESHGIQGTRRSGGQVHWLAKGLL